MTELTASRTLVKSPPELWAECSDATSLGRHLDHFGEIRITRLEPETAVAWEGEQVRGTVRLEPSGWGTRVVLTAQPVESGGDASEPEIPSSSAPEPTIPTAWEAEVPTASERDPAAEPESEGAAVAVAEPERDARPVDRSELVAAIAAEDGAVRRGVLARLRIWLRRRAAEPIGVSAPDRDEPEGVEPGDPAGGDATPPPATEAAKSQATETPVTPDNVAPATPENVAPATPENEEPAIPENEEPATQEEVAPAMAEHEAALEEALASLGQAHHRPFSRA